MNDCLWTDSNNLFRIVTQGGKEKPVVRWIDPKMINAAFHVWQRNGSSQHERSWAWRRCALLGAHLNRECGDHYQDKNNTTHFPQCFPPPQIIKQASHLSLHAPRRALRPVP